MSGHAVLPPATLVVAAVLATATGLAVAAIAGSGDGRLHVTVLDSGGGSAVLLRAPDGATALVDTGSSASGVVTALGRALPPTSRRLDLVVLLGGDTPLAAGLAGLVGHYAAEEIVLDGPVTPGEAGAAAQVEGGPGVRGDDASMSWHGLRLVPLRVDIDDGGRTGAIDGDALLVESSQGRALLLGDLPTPAQEALVPLLPRSPPALIVAPPGGALAPALARGLRRPAVAAPTAAGRRVPAAAGVPAVSATGVDGDLEFAIAQGTAWRR